MRLAASLLVSVPFVLAGCGAPKPASAPVPSKLISLSLPTDTGDLMSIPLSKPKATVLDFFAPTCVPCKRSIPAIVAKRAEIEAKGSKLVLVAVLGDGETTEQAESALKSWGVRSPFLVDALDASRKELGFKALPATFVVDKGGKVLWSAPPGGGSAGDVVGALP